MTAIGSTAAPALDFGEWPDSGRGNVHPGPISTSGRAGLRLAEPGGLLRGPGKYQVLERRRRHAQIAARRALALLEGNAVLEGNTLRDGDAVIGVTIDERGRS